jgi:hypothetical protein
MKTLQIIGLLVLLIMSSCLNNKKEQNSFLGKTYRLIDTDIFEDTEMVYFHWELLENRKFIYDSKWDDKVVLQQGNWDYFISNGKEYLILEELEQRIDTFKIIANNDFSYIEIVNLLGDTLHYEQVSEKSAIDTNLLFDNNWLCFNDSLAAGLDTLSKTFKQIYVYPEFQFSRNYEYRFKSKGTYSGKWKFNSVGNRIYLDSLNNDNEIIKIEKLTKDSLIFWKRDFRQNPKLMKCIKHNSL